MKTTIITCAVKIAIAILQYILKRYTEGGKGTDYIQDVQINEAASKMFKQFIESHTVKEAEKSASEGNGNA